MIRSLILFVSCMLVGCSQQEQSAASASDLIPRTADGQPNLDGFWQVLNTANWSLEPHTASQGASEVLGAIGARPPGLGVVEGGQIPYLPDALVQRERNFQNRRTDDPEAKCFRPGVPRATYMPYPFQIFQTESEIFITYQYALASRSIQLQDHMNAPFDSWMGWSNGRWEGDTLVVEVSGLNGQAWLDRAGNFTSDAVRVTERYTPQGPDHLLYSAIIEDFSVFSRPWTLSMTLYRLREQDFRLLEFKCIEFAEELMYGHLTRIVDEGAADNE